MTYNFPCNWKAAFVMNPDSPPERVGYLTDFYGLGLSAPLRKDLTVECPYKAPTYTPLGGIADGKVSVIGVLESVSWGGSVSDMFEFSCYMSGENAHQLRNLIHRGITMTSVSTIGWWVAKFDQGTKQWFEEHHPSSPPTPAAQVNAGSRRDIPLQVAEERTQVAPNIDVSFYNVFFQIVPSGNKIANFLVASSPTAKLVVPWGRVVGTGAI
jgi:hypothetical protein